MPKHKSAAGAPPLSTTVADLRALAHPLRLRMMELFAEKARTTKQVAELLGQPPTRLYHHVASLERSGLLTLESTRQNRGAVEKYYVAISRQLGGALAAGATAPEGKGARRALAMTVLEQARHEMTDALSRTTGEPPLLARLVVVGPSSVAVAVRARLRSAIAEIQREFAEECSNETTAPDHGAERWAITLAFAPVRTPGVPRKPRSVPK